MPQKTADGPQKNKKFYRKIHFVQNGEGQLE
jgi:hypothetical protein